MDPGEKPNYQLALSGLELAGFEPVDPLVRCDVLKEDCGASGARRQSAVLGLPSVAARDRREAISELIDVRPSEKAPRKLRGAWA